MCDDGRVVDLSGAPMMLNVFAHHHHPLIIYSLAALAKHPPTPSRLAYVGNSASMFSGQQLAGVPRPWTRAEDKLFETALVVYSEGTPDRWSAIAEQLPGRSAAEAWERYQALVHDCDMIERGMVELPECWGEYEDGGDLDGSDGGAEGNQPTARTRREERKRGVPWTEEEHR